VGSNSEIQGYNFYPMLHFRRKFSSGVTPYKRLGKISDILHLNNENNQLERQAQPPKDVPLDAQSWT